MNDFIASVTAIYKRVISIFSYDAIKNIIFKITSEISKNKMRSVDWAMFLLNYLPGFIGGIVALVIVFVIIFKEVI